MAASSSSFRLVRPCAPLQRLDVLPFAILYAGLLASLLIFEDDFSALASGYAIVLAAIVHALVALCGHWSPSFRTRLKYAEASDVKAATGVCVCVYELLVLVRVQVTGLPYSHISFTGGLN